MCFAKLPNKNAAPDGAACKPQYALFRYFVLKTGKYQVRFGTSRNRSEQPEVEPRSATARIVR